MKYAITPDKKIHQVVDEKEFYKNHPNAQDITALPNAYEAFEKQQEAERNSASNVVMAGKLGSRDEGETEAEHIAREAQWMEDHACQLCGSFECDGHCEDGGY